MEINEYRYLWESERADWVLVNTEFGYGIVNKVTQMALMISDEELESAIITKMLEAGNLVYENIIAAYSSMAENTP